MPGTNWLEKTHESYNNYYKTYYAAWCRKSGLPMLNSSCWERIQAENYIRSAVPKRNTFALIRVKCADGFVFGMDMFLCSKR